MRIHLFQALGNLLRVAIDLLRKEMELIPTANKVLSDAIANVQIHPDENGVLKARLCVAVVQAAVKLRVKAAAGQVDEMAFKICLDQLGWVVAFRLGMKSAGRWGLSWVRTRINRLSGPSFSTNVR